MSAIKTKHRGRKLFNFRYERTTDHFPKGNAQVIISVKETPPGNHTGTGVLSIVKKRNMNDDCQNIEKQTLLSSSMIAYIKIIIEKSMIKTEVPDQFPDVNSMTKTIISIELDDLWSCRTRYPESLLDCEQKDVDFPDAYKQLYYFVNDVEIFFMSLVQCHFDINLL